MVATNETLYWYQGECSEDKGKLDGRAIQIFPENGLQIGNYKQGNLHGQCMMIYNDGEKQIGTCNEGISNGSWLRSFPDGSSKTEIYQNGELTQVISNKK